MTMYTLSPRGSLSRWRHPFWKALALCALLAMWLPQLAWACPMTGHVGLEKAPCCQKMAAQVTGHCAQPQLSCCKPLKLPASQLPAALSPTFSSKFLAERTTAPTEKQTPQSTLPPAALAIAPTASCAHDWPPLRSRRWAQHGPLFDAGRAPPFC